MLAGRVDRSTNRLARAAISNRTGRSLSMSASHITWARRSNRRLIGAVVLAVAALGIAMGVDVRPVRAAAAIPEPLDPATQQALKKAVAETEGFDNRFDAEVWLVDMSRRLAARVPNVHRRLALLRDVHTAARKADLSPQLVLALIEVESNFQRFALSSAGAEGLMQIMPFWRAEIGKPNDNLFKRRTNLRYGCTILAYYLKLENDDRTRALARYNGSLGQTWYPRRIERALRRHWQIP